MKIIFFFLYASLLYGCAMSPAQTMQNPYKGSIASKLMLNGDLKYAQVTDLRAKKINGFLIVEAKLINITSYDDSLFYRFKWLDAKGFGVGDEEGWKNIIINGLQNQTITGASANKKIDDFRLELQSPNNTGGTEK